MAVVSPPSQVWLPHAAGVPQSAWQLPISAGAHTLSPQTGATTGRASGAGVPSAVPSSELFPPAQAPSEATAHTNAIAKMFLIVRASY